MPKPVKHKPKSRQNSKPSDPNQAAHLMVEMSTREQAEKPSEKRLPDVLRAYMAEIGRKGGKIGGKRRLELITPQERSSIASKAARAKWAKAKKK